MTARAVYRTKPTASCKDPGHEALSTRLADRPAFALRDAASTITKLQTNGAPCARNKATASCKDIDDDAATSKSADCSAFALPNAAGTITKLGTDAPPRARNKATASCKDIGDDAATSKLVDYPAVALRDAASFITKPGTDGPQWPQNKPTVSCKDSDDDELLIRSAKCRSFAAYDPTGSIRNLRTGDLRSKNPPLRAENANLCAKLLEGVVISRWLVIPWRKNAKCAIKGRLILWIIGSSKSANDLSQIHPPKQALFRTAPERGEVALESSPKL